MRVFTKSCDATNRKSTILFGLILGFTVAFGCTSTVPDKAPGTLEPAMEKALLETLHINTELYPPLWTGDRLKPVAREKLLGITEWTLRELAIPKAVLVEATISGSIANYNYSSFSDIDLHIFLNIDEVENKSVAESFMRSYSTVWNQEHEITLYGLPVNIFVKDVHGVEHSAGIYSVHKNQWVRKPKPIVLTVTRDDVLAIALPFKEKIETALSKHDEEQGQRSCEAFAQLRKDLRIFRIKSLEKNGEVGPGNLAYKVLRRAGLIPRLEALIVKCVDANYTLKISKPQG